jgi:hypothetical protein
MKKNILFLLLTTVGYIGAMDREKLAKSLSWSESDEENVIEIDLDNISDEELDTSKNEKPIVTKNGKLPSFFNMIEKENKPKKKKKALAKKKKSCKRFTDEQISQVKELWRLRHDGKEITQSELETVLKALQ